MSKTWFITLDHFGSDEDVVTIENTITCKQRKGSYYHVELDNGICMVFDKPILKIENEDDF